MSEITISIKRKKDMWTAQSDDVNLSVVALTQRELMGHVFEELKLLYGNYPDVDPSKYSESEKLIKQRLVELKSVNFIGDV